jgi:transketolase
MGVGSGIAYANKLLKRKYKTIILIGDGELYEGSSWEAIILGSQLKLSNMLFIIDRNQLITLGNTEKIAKLSPLKNKFKSFGLKVMEVDGHNIYKIVSKLRLFSIYKGKKPTVLICNTIKGNVLQ